MAKQESSTQVAALGFAYSADLTPKFESVNNEPGAKSCGRRLHNKAHLEHISTGAAENEPVSFSALTAHFPNCLIHQQHTRDCSDYLQPQAQVMASYLTLESHPLLDKFKGLAIQKQVTPGPMSHWDKSFQSKADLFYPPSIPPHSPSPGPPTAGPFR